MNHKFIPLSLFALSLVALSLVGDFLYRAPAQLAAIAPATTSVQRALPNATAVRQLPSAQKSILVVKLTREKAVELYPLFAKSPSVNAEALGLFKKYVGTSNAPIWVRPLSKFTVNGRSGTSPRSLPSNKFLQDMAGYLMVKFSSTADLATISRELSNDPNVVYAAESTLAQINATLNVVVTESTTMGTSASTGYPCSPGDIQCCTSSCWEVFRQMVDRCEKTLQAALASCAWYYSNNPGVYASCVERARNANSACLSEADTVLTNCTQQCSAYNPPTSSPPPTSGGGFGGTTPGRIYQDIPSFGECDPTRPLINCGPSGEGIVP